MSPEPFGGPSFRFLSKKNAKQNAAKQAVEYLVKQGHISRDTISKQSKNSASSTDRPSAPIIPIEDQSVPAQVAILAHKLGFKSPSYVIELVPDSKALFNGYAKFEGEQLIDGKVGEFRHVWSKKAAKDGCARDVLAFLKDIERQREERGKGEARVSETSSCLAFWASHGKTTAKVSRYDGCEEEEEEEDGMSEYGTPEDKMDGS